MELTPREQVVIEALTWLRTPFHHQARLKEVGVDCVMLLAEVYERAGVLPHQEIGYYPPDWHLHRDAERYLMGLLEVAHEVTSPLPGDVALFKFGRVFSHAGIVIEYPRIIHAYWTQNEVVYADIGKQPLLDKQGKPREVKYMSPFKDKL
jgi:cell wall-associated NlpC family hydrolase